MRAPGIRAHLLALAALALLAACEGGDRPEAQSRAVGQRSAGPPTLPAGDPVAVDGAARAAVRAPFRRSGGSRDLLCTLGGLVPASAAVVPEWLAASPSACRCEGVERPACRVVDLRGDRRRALLLPAAAVLRTGVTAPERGQLRFAVAAAGRRPTRLDVRVRVTDPATGGTRTWERQVRVVDRWVEASIDLDGFATRDLDLSIEAGSGPLAPAESRLALASPRIVVATRPEAPDPANVIVYLIDTLRPDRTSAFGAKRETTPRLAALAREALAFDRAYSVAAWTRPAVASLLTALPPGAHGVHTRSGLAPGFTTLAESFRDAGWSTWAFVTNGHVHGRSLGFEQGFDRFVAIPGSRRDNHARTAELNAALLPHLAAFGDEPFLLYVHAVDPHAPYDPPPSHRGLFADPSYSGDVAPADTRGRSLRARALTDADVARVRDLYDEDVRYQDDMLGVLLDQLERSGLAERTVVVVLSDHGEELYDRGDWEHGDRLFEELIRVPLVIRVPGAAAPAPRRIDVPVQIVDVMPTLLAWFGVPGAGDGEGRDLSPLVAGRPPEPRPVLCEELHPDSTFDVLSLTEGRWKLIRYRPSRGDDGPVRDLLFDLEADPGERNDLAGVRGEILARLRESLARHAGAPGRGTGGPAAELDAATRRQLEALGYVEGE